ncbi:serine protease [Streptomyces sp. TLI_171]|uniref:trypsin-like serine peptidase n=1 Tax=Streptomyces sp. TLI_171 TaxID=1938859 RepID=UPI000C186E27|nr:trypsin-like peptidase domain-containing protein [Streptomyces sp. TLI_171]RKE21500.1 V8-like Glu-specific endopeptidase [Streptomyces sp. TLI_171]
MTDQHRTPRRARTAATAALVTVLAVSTAACQSQSPSPVPPAASSTLESVELSDIQDYIAKVPSWTADDWSKWASKNGFTPEDIEAVRSFWDQKKLNDAKGIDTPKADTSKVRTPTAQEVDFPRLIRAKPQPHPYDPDTAVVGKILVQTGEGTGHCSGTVVSDPGNPGRSNLVWTAAHCVHGGKDGKAFKNLAFIPAFNRSGALSNGKGANASDKDRSPLGIWVSQKMYVMPQWTKEGLHYGNAASQFDFALVRVVPPKGTTRSLEETVGGSVPIWFNAAPEDIASPSAYGYPAADPFDGVELEHCDSAPKPTPFVFDRSRPPMLSIGCNMTGGSSGGGWFTRRDGKVVLFSNTSIGNDIWLAGPNLGADAKRMFEAFLQDK